MGYPWPMATSIILLLVALALPRLICGRPAATDDGGSLLSMLKSHVSKSEDFSDPEVISPLVAQEALSIPAKSRQRRLSDQRRAELETLVTLSKINGKRSLNATRGQLDPVRIGRRKRFTVDQAATELVSIKAKHIGDPAYPLIS
ncbi:uncharacterized protein LOC105835606 [Monomorium pharaonis]|uniref:uncharacterized protein LOC105835606 n=1 Tax=Monomorium pharaonis TaxID=307658 RepID=UPI00063F8F7F|nr:uncharacterized protein LOC105835606 [Monomorium pharaonis]